MLKLHCICCCKKDTHPVIAYNSYELNLYIETGFHAEDLIIAMNIGATNTGLTDMCGHDWHSKYEPTIYPWSRLHRKTQTKSEKIWSILPTHHHVGDSDRKEKKTQKSRYTIIWFRIRIVSGCEGHFLSHITRHESCVDELMSYNGGIPRFLTTTRAHPFSKHVNPKPATCDKLRQAIHTDYYCWTPGIHQVYPYQYLAPILP